MDQMAVLFKENQMLRRQNQSLLAASDARQKAVVGLLKETLGGKYDTDKAESESGDNDEHQKQQTRNQLVQLLLALLETPSDQSQQTASKGPQQLASTAFPNSDDATASSSGMQQRQPQEKSDQYSSSMPDVQPDNVSRCTEQQNSHSSGSEVANNIRKSSLSSGSSITGSQQLDWDTTALREIADQGRVPDGEMRADKYANETRKAIGIHTQNSMIRRNKSLGRRRSSLISHNSATSPNAEPKSFSKTGSNIPGTFPLNNLNPSTPSSPAYDNTGFSPLASEKIPKESVVMNDSEMGPLAASMLAPSELQFEPDPESRFVLYSPSAGIYESDHLHGLRSGDMTLADIVEASSRLLTLDHLRMERAGKQADYRLSQPPSSDSNEGCFWIDVTDPTPEEMASLARVFGIHPLTVEDIMADEDGRDKFETFTGYNFMMYRTIDYGEDARSTYEFNRGSEGIATASFAIILKQSCVLTFHRARGIGHVGNVISRLRELAPFDNSTGECISPHVITPAYIAYTLIDDITDTLAPEMRSVELEVDAVDELVLILSTNEQADMLKRIGSARRKILTIW
ncbi:CorA metal ion transporter, partial [Coemansia sp. RSA 2703]